MCITMECIRDSVGLFTWRFINNGNRNHSETVFAPRDIMYINELNLVLRQRNLYLSIAEYSRVFESSILEKQITKYIIISVRSPVFSSRF